MAHNGYRQQWQQPPLQRQHQYDNGNDPRAWQVNGPVQRPHQQRPQPPQNYPNSNSSYQNGHDPYGDQQGQWRDQQYQDPYQQNHQHNGQYQDPSAQPSQPNRTYQYDERYRNHAQPQNVTSQAQGNGYKLKDKHRPQPLAEHKKAKPRERILTEPESPKTLAWDNPFGSFPPKKKGQKHQKHASLDGAKGGMDHVVGPAVNSNQRPHTSQGHRKPDPSRPSTSHSQRPSPPPESPCLPPDSEMLLRKPPSGPDRNPQTLQTSLPNRPTPLRSVTQPIPSTRDPQFQEYGGVDPYSYDQSKVSDPRFGQRPSQPSMPAPLDQRRPSDQTHSRPPRRGSFDQDAYRGVPLHKSASNQQQTSVEMPNFDAISPPLNETTFEAAPAAPNQPAYAKKPYQALGQVDTQRQRPTQLEETTQSPLAEFSFGLPQASPAVRAAHANPQQPAHNLASPVRYDNPPLRNAAMRYDNPPPATVPVRYDYPPQSAAPQYDNPPQAGGPVRYDNPPVSLPLANDSTSQRNYDSRLQNQPPRSASQQQGPQSQFPPRGASRTDKEPAFERVGQTPNDSGYWQASPEQLAARPQTAGNSQARGQQPYRQGSRDNYGQGNEQGHGYEPASVRQPYERGPYSDPGNPYQQEPQYIQGPSSSRGAPMQADFAISQGRPQTANPAHPVPVRDHADRPRPDMPPTAGGFGDRPVPIRPGLANASAGRQSPAPRMQAPPMQAPPMQMQVPVQVPVHQPAAPTPQLEATTGPPPVTIAELNSLREGFKDNPNNHELGLRFAKRLVEAASVLSSEHGHADAKQTAKNRERYIFDATKVVKKMVNNNSPEAMFYLADCYGQGLLGLPVDPKEAFSLYQSGAKLNHPQSAYRVAVCCELGNEEGGGTRRDPLKAMQWYKRAAALGDTPAMYKMGMILLKGLLAQPRNPREAVSWLKRAAERADKDNPHALHELGLLYESASPADHILRDEKYALQLFTQAAELGYKYSQFRLGSAYEYGLIGCSIDPRLSIAWYTRAAAQGEHQSELALSGWYLTGSEPLLQQSDQEAYLWARKAASSGLAKAEYAMGYFSETGIGCTKDGEEARRWYYRAAAQNMTKARERLEELKRGAKMQQKTRVSRSHMGKGKDDCVVM